MLELTGPASVFVTPSFSASHPFPLGVGSPKSLAWLMTWLKTERESFIPRVISGGVIVISWRSYHSIEWHHSCRQPYFWCVFMNYLHVNLMIYLHANYVDLKLGNYCLEPLTEVSNRLKWETEVKDIKKVTSVTLWVHRSCATHSGDEKESRWLAP